MHAWPLTSSYWPSGVGPESQADQWGMTGSVKYNKNVIHYLSLWQNCLFSHLLPERSEIRVRERAAPLDHEGILCPAQRHISRVQTQPHDPWLSQWRTGSQIPTSLNRSNTTLIQELVIIKQWICVFLYLIYADLCCRVSELSLSQWHLHPKYN